MADTDDDEGPKELGSYKMGKVLGAGAFSKVKLGTHMTSGLQVAVKIVDKEMIQNIKDLERVMREMHVLKNIIHPNIIRLHEVMEKGARLFLVLDFAGGGELYDYVMDKGPLPEKQARTFFGQILSGVDFFHRQHVSHRDMKPENVLMVDNGNGALVCKIADFGLSNDMVPGMALKTICGTPAYAAPEITLGQKYDGIAVDIWSTGVILFFLVAGQIPFDCESQSELFKRIQNGTFSIPSHCSPELSDLIRRFMDVSPQKRITTAQAWLHPWLSSLNNRFLDLDLDDVDDDLEDAIDKEGADGDTGEKSVGEPGEGGGRFVNGVSFPTPTLELLGNAAHLPPACTEAAVLDSNGVNFLIVALSPASSKDGAGAGGGAEAEAGGGSKQMTMCWVAKKKEEAGGGASESASPVKGGDKAGDAKAKGVSIAASSKQASPARTGGKTLGTSPVLDTAGRSTARRRSMETMKAPLNDGQRAGHMQSAPTTVPSVSGDLCCVTSKEPKAIMRDLQRLFSDYKVSLRCLTAASIKGEKTRVRFELCIMQVDTLGGQAPASPLFVVSASRISGDSVTCRDVCRRLLLKL